MALVGSISGSLVAITGSIRPGADNVYEFGTSASKWLNVVATSVTGSITRLASGGEYLKPGNNITLTTGSDGSITITSTAAGGGGGETIFTAVDTSNAYTTSSIAIGFNAAASSKGSDVFFAVSGSTAGSNASLFAGPVVTSGSISVKDAGAVVAQITGPGVISGSGLQTVGNLAVQGTSALTGDVTFGGNIVADADEAKSIFAAVTSNAITVGGAGSSVDVAGSLKVTGNQISGSAGGNITLQGSGDVVVAGDLTVAGNEIKSGAGSTAITLNGTDVTVAGDLTVTGNDIVFSAGTGNIATAATTLTVGSSAGRVVIPGDLEVQGTTMTVSASNLVIEDPLVGFGFLSGSVATNAGDRGFIGGITGAGNNVAFGWSNSNSAFVATRTTSTPEDVTITVSALQPIRASKLEVNGTSAYVTSSAGTDLTVYAESGAIFKSNTAKVIIDGASEQGIEFDIGGVTFAEFKNTGSDARFGAVPTKALTVSGTTVTLDTNAATNFTRNGARVGQLIGTSGTEFKLAANNSTGGATNLVLSGSGLDLSANSSVINLKFADVGRGTISYGSNILQIGTTGSPAAALFLSGTNGVSLTHGNNGTAFVKDTGALAYLVVEGDGNDARFRATADLVLRADGNDIKFNNATQTVLTLATAGNNANFQGASNQQVNIGSVGSGGMTVSGSTVTVNAGAGGVIFQRDGVAELLVNLAGSTTTISGSDNQNVTLAAGTGATTLTLSGSLVVLSGSGITMFQNTTKISEIATVDTRTGFFPGADSSFDLGGPNRRWANIYTGDLHLRNERGSYTLIEEPDFLSIRFNKNGKRYKFLLERVPELDEPSR